MFRVFTENLELSQTQYHLEYDDHHIAFLTKKQYESFLKFQEQIKELEAENKQLLELSENLDEHPEGYDGPCLCKLCKSYG